MISKKSIPLSQFTVQISNPANRLTSPCVMVYEDGRFNMNTKLAGSLGGKKIDISFTPDMKHFALKEANELNSIFFPKSGSKKLNAVLTLLKERKIAFPAKYDVWYNEEDGFWQGDMLANPTQLPSTRRHNSKKN